MPGSRVKEVSMNLPTMLAAAAQLGSTFEFLLPVAPTLDRSLLQSLVGSNSSQHKITLVPESLPALTHSRAGIVASGTATVEAAMIGTPFVMVYRVSALTYVLGRSRVKVPYFAMVNLIAGQEVVPELVQQDFTANNVVAHLQKVLPDGTARDRMIAGMKSVRNSLRPPKDEEDLTRTPAERAAEIILSLARSAKL